MRLPGFCPHIADMSKLGWGVAGLGAVSAMAVAYSAVRAMAESEGGGGPVTLVLGGLAVIAVGGGLTALQFWSQRKGFDERAGARPDVSRHDIAQKDQND